MLYIYVIITLDLVRNCARRKSLSLELLEIINHMLIWLTYIIAPQKQYTAYRWKTKNWGIHFGRERMEGGEFYDLIATIHQDILSLHHSKFITNPGKKKYMWYKI